MEDLKNKNVIYKITSPTGRIYIGQSTVLERRWKEYKRLDCKNQVKLYNSFLKYGVENHTFEIIEECEFEQLNIRERYWQDFYNVLEEGLNCILTRTDILPQKMSEETKRKIAESNLGEKNHMFDKVGELHHNFGKKASEETCEKLSVSLTEYFNLNGSHWTGKTHSEESKIKMSNAKKGYKWSDETRAKIEGKFKGENNPNFGKKASDETRKKQSDAKKGKKCSEEFKNKLRELKGTKIINTQTKVIYHSIKHASEQEDISYTALNFSLRGKKENSTNLIFLSEYDENIIYENKIRKCNKPNKKVKNIETEEIFNSMKDAHKTTEFTWNYFRTSLLGEKENTTSFRLI